MSVLNHDRTKHYRKRGNANIHDQARILYTPRIVLRRARSRNFTIYEQKERVGRRKGQVRGKRKRGGRGEGRKGLLSRRARRSAAGFPNRFRASEGALCCNCFAVAAVRA